MWGEWRNRAIDEFGKQLEFQMNTKLAGLRVKQTGVRVCVCVCVCEGVVNCSPTIAYCMSVRVRVCEFKFVMRVRLFACC